MIIRCDHCRLQKELCLCGEFPRLDTRTRVVILMHSQELKKPSNTARWAHMCLPNSEIRLRGEIGKPLDLDGLQSDDAETWMLHLSEESELLTPELVKRTEKPIRLLVPDGTWGQASRLGSKLGKSMQARHVYLQSDAPTQYRLRSEHHPDGMATLEAIARALGIIEGVMIRQKMEDLFRRLVERELFTRGQLPPAEVYGGIPKGVKRS